jgi:group II intron reverse transcriptase/maturase
MLARQMPTVALTSLSHHIDMEWMKEALLRTRADGATGVDGVTCEEYVRNLGVNLQSLLDRAKTGRYRAPPVRRVHIPKGERGSETRPIGIPTFEDKLLQRAVLMALEPVYEQDFRKCSYGFRPGRSAHGALESLWTQFMEMGGGWLIEVDIRKFFDTLDHTHLQDLLRQRVRDGVLLRLIGKWLNAGVLEGGSITHPDTGTPQGGVISPLLANVYLHEVLDKWFEDEVVPHLRGRAFLVRYADDFVIGFKREDDARRVMEVLPKRFGKYGLTLHPTKTRLIPFSRPGKGGPGAPSPGGFDFLGFTHHWAKGRRGNWAIKRKTAKGRFSRGLRRIAEWCRGHRHRPIKEQHRTLTWKLRGHFSYFGITGNSGALRHFRHEAERIWQKWLARRSQRGMTWEKFYALLGRYPLPPPVAIHSKLRLAANH